MAYSKTEWKNLPDTTTPLNANNLNKIENELVKSSLNTASFLSSGITTSNNTYASVLSLSGETHGGNLLIIGVIGGLFVNSGMGYVDINVDGTRTRIGATNQTSKTESTSVKILTNVAAGTHSFSLDIVANNTITASAFIQNSLTIIEL